MTTARRAHFVCAAMRSIRPPDKPDEASSRVATAMMLRLV
jgi:hypothetical protein